ncbi:MAG: hypothetical protein U5K56_13710 [Halioglobus sp.]|nr:hypothetical protein [Halioglobus sp.]
MAMDDDGNFWVPGMFSYEHGKPEHMGYFKNFPGLYLAPGKPIWEDRLLQSLTRRRHIAGHRRCSK